MSLDIKDVHTVTVGGAHSQCLLHRVSATLWNVPVLYGLPSSSVLLFLWFKKEVFIFVLAAVGGVVSL